MAWKQLDCDIEIRTFMYLLQTFFPKCPFFVYQFY